MMALFCDMMDKEIKVYIDNIIVNLKKVENHMVTLKRYLTEYTSTI